jgi:hypothetical protein
MQKQRKKLVLGLLSMVLSAGAVVGIWSRVQSQPTYSNQPAFGSTLVPTPVPIPPQASQDSALLNPAFASLFYAYGPDWERNLSAELRQQVNWQRKVGKHAQVTGSGIGNPDFAYPEPRFIITVTAWDHTDLFDLGIPRTVDGKDVVILEMGVARQLGHIDKPIDPYTNR